MGRIRTFKPELFTHEGLFDVEMRAQLPVRWAFAGLFTCCDREGRFEWRPRRLKAAIMPYDDIDFAAILDTLRREGYVVKYQADGNCLPRVDDASGTRPARVDDASGTPFYGYIPTWKKHQAINNRESSSVLPAPTVAGVDAANNQLDLNIFDASRTREPRDEHADLGAHVHTPVEREGEREGEREVRCNSNPIDSGKGRGAQQTAAAISIPLNDKSEFKIQASQVQEWQELYQAIDVMAELVRFRKWCDENPKRRKTKRGVLTSIMRWLSEEQDKGGRRTREARVGADGPVPTPVGPSDPIPDGLDEARGKKLWHKALDVMEAKINRHTFDTWLKPLRSLGMNGSALYVSVPNPEFRMMFEKYSAVANDALAGDGVESIVPLCVNWNG